jgi:hypothetical protein
MRAIMIALPGQITLPVIERSPIELRTELFQHLERHESDLCQAIAARTRAYLPPEYRVFAAFHSDPERLGLTTQLWIIDPTMRWRGTFFARRAWALLLPVVSNAAAAVFAEQLQQVSIKVPAGEARVTVYAPTRGWLDPTLIAVGVAAVVSWFWLYGYGLIGSAWRGGLG